MKGNDFEVIIAPTDVLEKELAGILGGSAESCSCKNAKCKGHACNCEGMPADSDADCPEGFIAIDGWCVEVD